MTTTEDPFAKVAAQQAAASGTKTADKTAPAADPFTATADMDDPFATSEDYRGGDFTPSPPIELLRGRLLAYFPRKFEAEANDPFNEGKKRELYTADIYVLDGGDLKFPYKVKGDPEKGTEDEWKEWDGGTPSPAAPFVMKQSWVPQGNIIAKLKKAHADGVPMLGVLDFIPQKAARDKGVTAAQIRKEYDAWVKRGKTGGDVKIAWALDVPDPERRKLAVEFWAAHKAEIEPINRATAPAPRN